MHRNSLIHKIMAFFAGATLFCPSLLADEKKQKASWEDKAEISYVLTAGNSSLSTFGFMNTFNWALQKIFLKIQASALRSHATIVTRTAVGTPEDYKIIETRENRLAAENYFLSGQFEHKIYKSFLWYAGLSWERNRFTGIENRTVLTTGSGKVWFEKERDKFKTVFGLTYTFRRYISAEESDFLGLRASGNYERRFGGNAIFSSQLIFDANLNELPDWRADMLNSLSVTISRKLALKTSLRWLYTNRPALEKIPLKDPAGRDTGRTILSQLRKLDSFFTTSLVINF